MLRSFLAAILFFAFGTAVCEAAPKRKANKTPETTPDEFRAFVAACFPRWDRNTDSMIDLQEINALIENPAVRGNEAAAAVVIRRRIKPDAKSTPIILTREDLLTRAGKSAMVHEFSKVRAEIRSIPRMLFMHGEPSLANFHQGGVGDCYLLAMVGAAVHRNPADIRAMFRDLPGNSIEVRFGNGRTVAVPPITDAELVLGARMGKNHGIWLSVLEKAYSSLREDKKERRGGKTIDDDDAITKDLISGGSSTPVIEQLTGHKVAGASLTGSSRSDVEKNAEHAHELLSRLMRQKRLTSTSGVAHLAEKPKGIIANHIYGVVAYDSTRRLVRVFNPWGNEHTPKGPPGMVHGYVTRHGLFDVPLKEFVQIFSNVSYETDKPLKK